MKECRKAQKERSTLIVFLMALLFLAINNAIGAPTTYTLTVNTIGSGSVDPSGGTYKKGTVVTLTAEADPDWIFDHWEDDLSGSANPETITMDSDKTVTAVFVEDSGGITFISPDNSNILYTGRVDFSNPQAPVFGWSGVSITANFEGTSINAIFDDGGSNYSYVIIDDGELTTLDMASGEQTYTLADGLSDTVHKIDIIRKTEGYDGHTTFLGFELDNGKTLASPPSRPPLKLEFYGDSHASGLSCECTCDSSDTVYKNNYMAYPGITSQMLNAEYSSISWSGIGIAATNQVITDVWDRTLPNTSGSTWNFSGFIPDAVVINLGANDYYWWGTQEEIMQGWEDFVTNYLRPVYPDAHICFANSYGWAIDEPADYVHLSVQNLINAGDTNVSYVLFPWLWSQAHAVICEQAGHANILAAHLADELGLSAPTPADFSCIPDPGELTNGGFENDTLPDDSEADGWRSFSWKGSVSVVDDLGGAHSGARYMEVSALRNGYAGCYMATDGEAGVEYTASAYMKATSGNTGKLRIEFKDQSQSVISQVEGQKTVTGSWVQYSTVETAPAGTWSVVVVCIVDSLGNNILYDDVTLTAGN